jgi:hypothetical protein
MIKASAGSGNKASTGSGAKASTGSGNKTSTGSGAKASTGSGNKGGGMGSGKTPLPEASAPPRPMRLAARLTLAGAAGTVVYGLYGLIVALANRATALRNLESVNHMTASKASSEITFLIVFSLVECIAAAALWVWMGRANRSGHGWARIAASVLFLLWTYKTYASISVANTAVLVSMIITLIIWGIGGAVISQLWLPESTAYFKSFSR